MGRGRGRAFRWAGLPGESGGVRHPNLRPHAMQARFRLCGMLRRALLKQQGQI